MMPGTRYIQLAKPAGGRFSHHRPGRCILTPWLPRKFQLLSALAVLHSSGFWCGDRLVIKNIKRTLT